MPLHMQSCYHCDAVHGMCWDAVGRQKDQSARQGRMLHLQQ